MATKTRLKMLVAVTLVCIMTVLCSCVKTGGMVPETDDNRIESFLNVYMKQCKYEEKDWDHVLKLQFNGDEEKFQRWIGTFMKQVSDDCRNQLLNQDLVPNTYFKDSWASGWDLVSIEKSENDPENSYFAKVELKGNNRERRARIEFTMEGEGKNRRIDEVNLDPLNQALVFE